MTNIFGKNLKNQREKSGMSQKELAQKINVSTSALSQYETGSRTPCNAILCELADIFTTTVDELLGRSVEILPIQKVKRIPIVRAIKAGEPMIAEHNIVGMIGIPDDFADDGQEYFALKASGDSMNLSGIFDRQIVIARKQAKVANGEIAVVLIDNKNATVKRFYKNGDIVTLVPNSSNQDYTPKTLDTSKIRVEVLGIAVQAITNL